MLIKLSEVKAKYGMDIKGIIHVGAHIGQEFEEYMTCLVKHVAFFEPCTPAYKKLEEKFIIDRTALGFPEVDVKLFQVALGNYHGEAVMNVEKANEGQSNSLLEPAKHLEYYPSIEFGDQELVKVTLLDAVELNLLNYNMLNMDVQGYELEVLKGGSTMLKFIDYVYTEVNTQELYKGNATLAQLDEFLSEFDRVELNMTDVGWGDALYIRKKRADKIPAVTRGTDQEVSLPLSGPPLAATEEIELGESIYLNGMVVQDENNIYLGSGVAVVLDKHRYILLAGQMSSKLARGIEAQQKADADYWERTTKVNDLLNELRAVFYDVYSDTGIQKDLEDIDVKKLDELLKNNSNLFGFE